MRARKLFVGRKLREIRTGAGLTQAAFAGRLGISTSYLNQMENNQRHVTAPVLLALAAEFAVDIAAFSENDGDRLLADLGEALADPLFGGTVPPAQELTLAIRNTPAFARAFLLAHQACRRAGERLAELDDTLERSGRLAEPTPYDEVRDFFHYQDNYIHGLDTAAEALAGKLPVGAGSPFRALADYIERRHRVQVTFGDGAAAAGSLRRFEPDSRRLTLNPRAGGATNAFQIAYQVAVMERGGDIGDIVAGAGFRSGDAEAVCRMGLANYFAGATLLPYGPFAAAARDLRHDLELLADRFGASLEQVCHRLSTLQRPGARGIPFFFARVDQAGNINKRHSATKLQFARFGAACPLWNVHRAFETPNRIIRQLAETPDGVRYLCLAATVAKRAGGYRDPVRRYALALGCEIRHAPELIYADDLDPDRDSAFEPIGISCRLCDRRDCHQRSLPPLKRSLRIDPNTRNPVPFGFD